MGRIIIALVVIAALLYLFQWCKKQYQLKGRSFCGEGATRYSGSDSSCINGHWPCSLARRTSRQFAGRATHWFATVNSQLPDIAKSFAAKASAEQFRQQSQQAQTPNVSIEEALDILGLSGKPTREQIVEAHRKLIQKLHPDRGGNDYLAAKINQAKKVLLDSL